MKTKKADLRAYGICPGKGRNYENIIYVLALIYNRLQTQAERYLSRYQLTALQFNLLMLAAYQNEGKGLSQVEIAKRLIVSASNITKLVEKSVQEGLLTRKTNPLSRRENVICITAKGQKRIDTLWPGYDNLVRGLTEKIPAKHRLHLEQILNNWLTDLWEEK